MRNFRKKPVGWRNDTYRHYLAAKYGSAGRKRYFQVTEDPGLLGGAVAEGYADEVRKSNVDKIAAKVREQLERMEEERDMPSDWTERFMEVEFKQYADKYLADRAYDRKHFEEDVLKRAKVHAQVNGRKLSVFEWLPEDRPKTAPTVFPKTPFEWTREQGG